MLKLCGIKRIPEYMVPLTFEMVHHHQLEEPDLMSILKYATDKYVLFLEGKILFIF